MKIPIAGCDRDASYITSWARAKPRVTRRAYFHDARRVIRRRWWASLKFLRKWQIQKFWRQNQECVKFDNSFDFESILPHTRKYFALDDLSFVINGAIFEAVGYTVGSDKKIKKFWFFQISDLSQRKWPGSFRDHHGTTPVASWP